MEAAPCTWCHRVHGAAPSPGPPSGEATARRCESPNGPDLQPAESVSVAPVPEQSKVALY